jgi:trehalose 2-sulfotransferase
MDRLMMAQPQNTASARENRIRLTDEQFDFKRSVPLRKSYIVASSYRCGSTFLCVGLWQTGLLGAPWEYLNTNFELGAMTARLQASSPADYVRKLLGCRTSLNGVFGMKAHFPHFEAGLKRYPQLLETLSPLSYVYINRRDKLAQAVSMAKAFQTKSWTSLAKPDRSALRYDRQHIARCLEEAESQRLGWLRWFENNNVTPFVVNYEDLLADKASVIDSIVELLDVAGDQTDEVDLVSIDKQGDRTNEEWIERFRQGG